MSDEYKSNGSDPSMGSEEKKNSIEKGFEEVSYKSYTENINEKEGKTNSDTKNIDNNPSEYPELDVKNEESVINTTDFVMVDSNPTINKEKELSNSEYLTYNKRNSHEVVDSYTSWTKQISSSNRRNEELVQLEEEKRKKELILNEELVEQKESIEHTEGIWSIPHRDPLLYKEEKQKKASLFRKLIGVGAMAIVFGLIASITYIGVNEIFYGGNSSNKGSIGYNTEDGLHFNEPRDPSKQITSTTVGESSIEPVTSVSQVVEDTMPSIVTIDSTFPQMYQWFGQEGYEDSTGGGSGIIVGENDSELLIVTNNHVVEGATKISVTFLDDYSATAIVKGTDVEADLAVIAIDLTEIPQDTKNAIKIATIGDSENVKVGEMAIAIGNALGYGQSTTVGYIGAKDRTVNIENTTMVLLQTDAAINPGNSGGALLNIKGEVIGINTIKYSANEVEGMGFAIPISKAMPIVNELMLREVLKDDEKGYLGVMITDITQEQANMYSWPVGVYVSELVENGAAIEAGILQGDIITWVNGVDVSTSEALIEKVTSYRHGTEITIKVMRREVGKFVEKEIKVILREKTN